MDTTDQHDVTLSRPVVEMLMVANEYCVFMEKADSQSSEKVIAFFTKIAPLLFLRGNLLPEIEQEEDFIADRFVTEEQWENVFKTLRKIFGPLDSYFALNETHDIIEASLSDNMADIYQDMKDFVMVFQKNTYQSRLNAITQARILFAERWGSVLLQALFTCHKISLNAPAKESDDFDEAW